MAQRARTTSSRALIPCSNPSTATVEGEATWTISRDANGRVTGLTNGVKNVAVNRDGSGAVAGTSVGDV